METEGARSEGREGDASDVGSVSRRSPHLLTLSPSRHGLLPCHSGGEESRVTPTTRPTLFPSHYSALFTPRHSLISFGRDEPVG